MYDHSIEPKKEEGIQRNTNARVVSIENNEKSLEFCKTSRMLNIWDYFLSISLPLLLYGRFNDNK